MRSYPRNSPEAAARIVALALLADGHLCDREMRLLHRLGVAAQLGLAPVRLQDVVRELCEDLLQGERLSWAGVCQVGPDVLRQLLAEIEDTALRLHVLRLCARVVEADGVVTDGEALVLTQAVEQWQLERQMLEPEPQEWRQAA